MKIAIIDSDLLNSGRHRFPNLACMKISGYYKDIGAEVELLTDYSKAEEYDRVFISKVFSDTKVPEAVLALPNVEYGGTGFFYDKAPKLPEEIEHHFPDYNLYSKWVESQLEAAKTKWSEDGYDLEDFNETGFMKKFSAYTAYSIGFTTRGCIHGCPFCVNQHYRRCSLHSPVSEFLDPNRPYIYLLDDNVLACPDWKQIFEELNATGKRFSFHQGMDERLLTDEKCEVIFKSNWIGDFIFAFDNIADRKVIVEKLQMIRRYTDKVCKFYCFTGFNHENKGVYERDFWSRDIRDLFERIKILIDHKCLPYVMRYEDYATSPYRGMYVTIARWCNQPSFFKKSSFREFCEKNAKRGQRSSIKYLEEFEKEYPQIARTYFDMKWSDADGRCTDHP